MKWSYSPSDSVLSKCAMPSQNILNPTDSIATAPQVIESRQQYRSCHIRVPHSEQRLPAISLNTTYYSFFKIEKDKSRAIELSNRLHQRGELTVITKTPKGYVIWVREAEAQLSQPTVAASKTKTSYRILTSPSQYQPCYIQVPDLDGTIAAINVDGKYYSLLKITADTEQTVQLIKRLGDRSEETIITKTTKGYGVWIFEPKVIA